jgi:hypothetical protein
MAERRDNGAMRKIWAVAFREVRHTVLTKGFIFGALVVPVLMFGAIAAIGLLVGMQVAPVSGTVALIDPSGSVAEFARTELTPEQVAKDMEEMLRRSCIRRRCRSPSRPAPSAPAAGPRPPSGWGRRR